MIVAAFLSVNIDSNPAKAAQQLRRLAEDAPPNSTISIRVPDHSSPDWAALRYLVDHCRAARLNLTGGDTRTVGAWLDALTGDPFDALGAA